MPRKLKLPASTVTPRYALQVGDAARVVSHVGPSVGAVVCAAIEAHGPALAGWAGTVTRLGSGRVVARVAFRDDPAWFTAAQMAARVCREARGAA